jgi:DNA excision repair protein ERCC-2
VEIEERVKEIFRKAGLKPRPLQLEAAKQLAEMIDTGSVGFQAPTGFGKTLVVLAALISSSHLPAVWRVRTYALARHIANQAMLIELKYFIAGGRERTCPLAKELGPSLPFFCRYFKYKCHYFRNLSSELPEATSYEELVASGISGCLYYRQLNTDAKLIITTYNVALPFQRDVDVIDEAHNAIRVQSLPLTRVREALAELGIDDYGITKELRYPGFFVEKELPIFLERLDKNVKMVSAPVLFNMLMGAETTWIDEGQLFALKIVKPKTPTIYVSATLSPLAKILRIPVIKVPQPRRDAFVTTWLTTKFNEFDVFMGKAYGDLIFLLRKYFGRILVFASERVGALLHPTLSEDDLPLPPNWEGVLLLSPRGRWAEGVDISADAVVLAGAPYPPPGTIRGLSHDDFVVITTLQAVGRAIRDPTHSPVIILADQRFSKIQQLSEYFELREVHDLPELDRVLKEWKQRNTQQ